MSEFRFEVQGSASEPYEVWISRSGDNLSASCTCPAGQNFTHCKHRLELLRGNPKGVIGGDVEAIPQLPDLLVGTDVGSELADLADAEEALTNAKKRVSNEKKRLARTLAD